jgi:hypothetical protein
VLVINPLAKPDLYLRQLVSCRSIASSSLHGMIFADAYGIPNVWFHLRSNLLKTYCLRATTFIHDHFKYFDYFESVGRHCAEPIEVQDRFPWEEFEEYLSRWQPMCWDPLPLLDSFPYKPARWDDMIRAAQNYFQAGVTG